MDGGLYLSRDGEAVSVRHLVCSWWFVRRPMLSLRACTLPVTSASPSLHRDPNGNGSTNFSVAADCFLRIPNVGDGPTAAAEEDGPRFTVWYRKKSEAEHAAAAAALDHMSEDMDLHKIILCSYPAEHYGYAHRHEAGEEDAVDVIAVVRPPDLPVPEEMDSDSDGDGDDAASRLREEYRELRGPGPEGVSCNKGCDVQPSSKQRTDSK